MDTKRPESGNLPRPNFWTILLGLLVILTFIAALADFAVGFPNNFLNIQSEPGITSAYQAVEQFLSLEQLGFYFLIARYVVASIAIATAAVYLLFGMRHPLALGVALFFCAAGPAMGLAGNTGETPNPAPYNQAFSLLNLVFLFLFMLGAIYLGQVYPDGKYALPWIKKTAPWTGGTLVVGVVLALSGAVDSIGESAWTSLVVLLLFNFALSALSVIVRLASRRPDLPRKGLIAFGLLFVWITISISFSERIDPSPLLKLAGLHIDLLVIGLLAVSLFADLWEKQFWGMDIRPFGRNIFASYAGFMLLVALSGWAGAGQVRSARAMEESRVDGSFNHDIGPLIVDTDMGNDDVLALLYLMEHPGVELQAVTVVGTGLVHCEPGVKNALGLLKLAEYPDIPVACGSETPFGAEHEFPNSWRAAADRLWGFGLEVGDRQADARSAPEVIADILRNSNEPATILALGPLTNFAEAFENEPALVQHVGMLYQMGGAVEVPGNVYDEDLGFDNKTAEWNIYADPVAARRVFETGVPITLVPLDATNYVPVDFALYRRFETHHADRVSTFVFNIFYINQGWISTGLYYLWDTLAAAAVTAPEVVNYESLNMEVITQSGPDFGRTAISEIGRPVRVATSADATLFKALFVRTLASP